MPSTAETKVLIFRNVIIVLLCFTFRKVVKNSKNSNYFHNRVVPFVENYI